MGEVAEGEGLGVEPAELGLAEAIPRIKGAKALHRRDPAANRPGLGTADLAALAGMAKVPVGLPELPAPALPLHRHTALDLAGAGLLAAVDHDLRRGGRRREQGKSERESGRAHGDPPKRDAERYGGEAVPAMNMPALSLSPASFRNGRMRTPP